MTLFQIIQAILAGQVVVFHGSDFAGRATVGNKTVAEWDNDQPAECWLEKPDGSRQNIWQLTSPIEGGVSSSGPGVCPAAH